MLFDGDWRFAKGDAEAALEVAYDDGDWRSLSLPHDWSIEGPFSQDVPAKSGGYLPGGVGWYRKHFNMAPEDMDRRVWIEFDGVYKNADVWLNGHHLGFHPYGYTSFRYDLTLFLEEGENVLAVRVDNSQQPDTRWYTGSGIYRHVWLVVTDSLHVDHWGTYVTTPSVAEDLATVAVTTWIKNNSAVERGCTLVTSVVDAAGAIAATEEVSQPIAPGERHEAYQMLALAIPHLWSIEDPYLYRIRSEIREGDGRIVDACDTPFGVRVAHFDAEQGFVLNGKQVKINGVCLHHDAGAVGAAVPERVLERRLEILKEMGCNGIRCSHNPPAPELLDMADRMGFVVMDEAFDEWKQARYTYGYHDIYDAWAAKDLLSMLHRDRNHPSVVLWSVGNEIPEQNRPEGVRRLKDLIDICHREDPTRPVTSACDRIEGPRAFGGPTHEEFLAALDVVGYNYVDRWEERGARYYTIDHFRYPERRMIGSENVSVGGVRGAYSLGGEGGGPWHRPYNVAMIRAEQLWKATSASDYVAGDFMWTGIDYLGESWWPHKNASSGPIDLCGFKKDGFYFYQSQWTEAPMLHLFPHWNWEGQEGQVIPVLCYSNCDTVELFVNGVSWGTKSYRFAHTNMDRRMSWFDNIRQPRVWATTGDLHLAWDVPYAPGALKAVGMRDGEVVCVQEIATAGAAAKAEATIDRTQLRADGRDVAHVTVRILDAEGRFVPTADDQVTFEVEGPGTLIGVDNGDPASHASFQAHQRQAFNGMCLAIVQSTGEVGEIRVRTVSEGLAGAEVVVSVMEAHGSDA